MQFEQFLQVVDGLCYINRRRSSSVFAMIDRKFGLLCLYFSGDYEEDKSRDYKEGCKENRFSKLFNFTSRRIDLNGHFLPFRKV